MGKDKDFSVFIRSGHCIVFSCVVYSYLKAFWEENGEIKLTEKLAILQYGRKSRKTKHCSC